MPRRRIPLNFFQRAFDLVFDPKRAHRLTFWERYFGGHVSIRGGRIVLFGWNAMHVTLQIHTKRGWLCIHPPVRCFGRWWPWYVYLSPDATPSGSIWGYGYHDSWA